MNDYWQLLTTELLQEARKKLNNIRKGSAVSAPLRGKDVYPKASEEKKLNKDTSTTIQSLKAEGRKLELHWKASTKGTVNLEEQRSFRPTTIGWHRDTGQVPPLMHLAALTVWDYGEELSTHDLPVEFFFFVFFFLIISTLFIKQKYVTILTSVN